TLPDLRRWTVPATWRYRRRRRDDVRTGMRSHLSAFAIRTEEWTNSHHARLSWCGFLRNDACVAPFYDGHVPDHYWNDQLDRAHPHLVPIRQHRDRGKYHRNPNHHVCSASIVGHGKRSGDDGWARPGSAET